MILSPLQNTAMCYIIEKDGGVKGMVKGNGVWRGVRPTITQEFGNIWYQNGQNAYAQFGMLGHNGIDFQAEEGTQLFSPIDGYVFPFTEKKGYGNAIFIRNAVDEIEIVLGHLKELPRFDANQKISAGEKIGFSGNSGFSTAPHLHMGIRKLIKGQNTPVYEWGIKNYDNGYKGYYNFIEELITWKGGFVTNNI